MIVEGIITEIDYSTNSCIVRLPIFEETGNLENKTMQAKFLVLPGNFNNYSVNDMVWVTFVEDSLNKALIIGKIYKSPIEEQEIFGGVLNTKSLTVKNFCSLPKSTIIVDAPQEYNTIEKIINKLKSLDLNK